MKTQDIRQAFLDFFAAREAVAGQRTDGHGEARES
jgi:hypothetical protein